MPSTEPKLIFDAINILKAENIYLTESKKDQNKKRKNTTTDDIIQHKKLVVPDLGLRAPNPSPSSTKHKRSSNSKCVSKDVKLKNNSSAVMAARKSRKRQLDIGNAYSKLNSQLQNPAKYLEVPKKVLGEQRCCQSSFYLTPRQDILNDFENINPNHLPESFYECELDEFIGSQYSEVEDFSEYDLQEPLVFENFNLPQEDLNHKKCSLHHFKELLDKEQFSKNKLLEKSEIELLKDIVKADERYRKLKKDDYQLIKEILLGQLKEIVEQERVIKTALEKIRLGRRDKVEVDTFKVAEAEQPLEKSTEVILQQEKVLLISTDSIKVDNTKNNAGQGVDVFFKNVPSLEREIRILKLLGHKLEETLKKSTTQKTTVKTTLTFSTFQCVYFKHSTSIASSKMLPFSSKSTLGLVQEFKISLQTINELKLERDFYIATDSDNFTLQRTNFELLRHQPELLLKRLKPITKDSRLKFNFIEQDPLFLNYFLANICKISSKSFATHETFIPENHSFIVRNNPKQRMIPPMAMSDGAGDHCDIKDKEKEPKLELPFLRKKSSGTSIGRKKYKQRRTPLQENNHVVSAKNSLIKTILLGSVHLTIVLMVLTAVLYPDVICF